MKSKITTKRVFKPVTLEITLETLEELKEFELRMALYRHSLVSAINKQSDLGCSVQYIKGQNAPTGIGPLRSLLHGLLKGDSDIKSECWYNRFKYEQ